MTESVGDFLATSAAVIGAGVTVLIATKLGFPISTTHSLVGGLLGAGIALLALNIWTTNDNALYASGLGLANITGLQRKHLTIVAGAIGTVFSIFLYNT